MKYFVATTVKRDGIVVKLAVFFMLLILLLMWKYDRSFLVKERKRQRYFGLGTTTVKKRHQAKKIYIVNVLSLVVFSCSTNDGTSFTRSIFFVRKYKFSLRDFIWEKKTDRDYWRKYFFLNFLHCAFSIFEIRNLIFS
jgi:hypothetical protein